MINHNRFRHFYRTKEEEEENFDGTTPGAGSGGDTRP